MLRIYTNYGNRNQDYYLRLCDEEREIFDIVIAKCKDYVDFRDKIFETDFDEDLLWECARKYCHIDDFNYINFLNDISDDFYDCVNKKAIVVYDDEKEDD